MGKILKAVWNVIGWVLVVLIALLAVTLVAVRLLGLRPYVVLSGSMEPTYQTGSLIFVKDVDPFDLESGDVITFMLNEDTVATHRVAQVVPDETDPSVVRFRTKGDVNEFEDSALVHYKNVIGSPVIAVPYVGYAVSYISEPPGLYIGLIVLAVVVVLMFAPNLLRAAEAADKRDAEKKKAKAGRNTPSGK